MTSSESKIAAIVPAVPKLLKHSQSEATSRLPEISHLKLRKSVVNDQRLMAETQIRNLTTRNSSIKKVVHSGINVLTPTLISKHVSMKQFKVQRGAASGGTDYLKPGSSIHNEQSLAFRMRSINPVIRNGSCKLLSAMNTTTASKSGKTGQTHNFQTARNAQKRTLNNDHSDNSDLMTEHKSHNNLQNSDGTHSTNTSSKINSDSFQNEPKLATQVKQSYSLFKTTPKNVVQPRSSNHSLLLTI